MYGYALFRGFWMGVKKGCMFITGMLACNVNGSYLYRGETVIQHI